jgi:hypothetical protein
MAKPLNLKKSYIFYCLNLYLLAKLLTLFGKTYTSWQNLHIFMAKSLNVDKTSISSQLNFYHLEKIPTLLN